MPEKGINLLLMDDEKSIRDIYKNIFTLLGYKISLASNGDDAIKLVQNAFEEGGNFDVAVLDLTIHGGKGGKETIKQLKKIDPKIKCIAVSGYANDPIFINHKEYGFDTVVRKPFKVQHLSKLIQDLMDK